jgi:hypothetical protein
MGAGTRDDDLRLLVDLPAATREPELALDVAALRVELLVLEPRFAVFDAPLRDDIEEPAERPDDALRADVPDAAADRPRDFVLFVLFLLPLRDELLARDFPRDFLALVAIDASPRVVDGTTTSTIARIRHIRKSVATAAQSCGAVCSHLQIATRDLVASLLAEPYNHRRPLRSSHVRHRLPRTFGAHRAFHLYELVQDRRPG